MCAPKPPRRYYVVTYRQRLNARELAYVKTMRPLSIEETTPAGWTRRVPTGKGGVDAAR